MWAPEAAGLATKDSRAKHWDSLAVKRTGSLAPSHQVMQTKMAMCPGPWASGLALSKVFVGGFWNRAGPENKARGPWTRGSVGAPPLAQGAVWGAEQE